MESSTRYDLPTWQEARDLLRDISGHVGGGKNPYLFTQQDSSAKLLHNYDVTHDYEQIVMYLPQANRGRELFEKYASGLLKAIAKLDGVKFKNVCPHSTLGCRNTCLGYAGRLASPPTERAMLARYVLYCMYPKHFWVLAKHEITMHGRRLRRQGLGRTLVVRFNGTSDIDIIAESRAGLVDLFTNVWPTLFFDYTKRPLLRSGYRKFLPNYYLVRSITERDGQDVFDKHDGNVVVPVNVAKDEPLPKTFMGRRVVDGDKHDLRFMDKQDNRAVLVRVKKRNDGRPAIDNGFIREVV